MEARRIRQALALSVLVVLAGVSLAACGGESHASASGSPSSSDDPVRTVTVEALGTGTAQDIVYLFRSSTWPMHLGPTALPWSKTEQFSVDRSDLKVGTLVYIIPGGILPPPSDGRVFGGCRIAVNGKVVVEVKAGDKIEACRYLLK